MRPELSLDTPAQYQIEVQGYLEEHWTEWLDGMQVEPQVNADGIRSTRLTGKIIDQAALHGLLLKLYNLGFPLLSVNYFENDCEKESRK